MTGLSQEQTLQAQSSSQAIVRRLKAWLPKRWYAHAILLFAVVAMGFPMFYAIIVSTQTNADVFNYRFTPGNDLARNWDVVVNQRNLFQFMLNSVFVALVMTTGKAVLSLLAGLAFVFFRFPFKWLVFGFVLLTLMMPTEVMAIALFRLVGIQLQWGDTYAAMIVPFIASATGVFLFRQHFSNIPAELSEAAQMDGATPIQFLFRVLIPISWNAIAALFVIQFLYAWNQYLWPLMIIQDTALKPVQVGLRTLVAGVETGDSFGPLMLGAVIASIPPLIVFIALQKQFMSGFALTRDK
ncbi:MAG: glycerol-3-phosphate ABC transporter permease [Anaerolineaceae bacterium]|nr:glycerol-3-phosphate ABC transporter permease [Anaerolineaceae bacterium]